jgi:hypothetical protein
MLDLFREVNTAAQTVVVLLFSFALESGCAWRKENRPGETGRNVFNVSETWPHGRKVDRVQSSMKI